MQFYHCQHVADTIISDVTEKTYECIVLSLHFSLQELWSYPRQTGNKTVTLHIFIYTVCVCVQFMFVYIESDIST